MSNVKPGDRAVIVKANYPENLGKIVTVVEPFDRDIFQSGGARYVRALFPQDEQLWVIESLGGPLRTERVRTAIYPDGRVESSSRTMHHSVCCVLDAQLRRLDPPEDEVIDVSVKDSLPVVEEIQS